MKDTKGTKVDLNLSKSRDVFIPLLILPLAKGER